MVFDTHFPTATGRAKFVPADLIPAAEQPDADYPMVLITGRQLEHWHTGAMTRRAGVLDAIEPRTGRLDPSARSRRLGVQPGDSRDGRVAPRAASRSTRAPTTARRAGAVFIPFCFYEAAANMLTNPVLDPVGKIPEFKYCAVRVTPGGRRRRTASYGGGQAAARISRGLAGPAGFRPLDRRQCGGQADRL